MDAEGHTRRVAMCPAPWTQPHPPVFVSGSGSPDTIAFCGKHGFVPTYFTNIQSAGPLSETFPQGGRGVGTLVPAGREPVHGALDPDRQDARGCAEPYP